MKFVTLHTAGTFWRFDFGILDLGGREVKELAISFGELAGSAHLLILQIRHVGLDKR